MPSTPELLTRATLYGQCQLSPQQAATLLEMSPARFEKSDLFEAFVRGRLHAQVAVRRSVVKEAQEGDPAAQKEFFRLAAESHFEVDP
jgi:hypothetical protein